MGNIAMFGGAFNPIHKGHVHLALSMLKQYALDKVLLIPSGTPPHKSAPDLAAGEHRLAMCRLAAQAHPPGKKLHRRHGEGTQKEVPA